MFPSAMETLVPLGHPSFRTDQNPNSKQEESPLIFHFPPQFLEDHHQVIFQNQSMVVAPENLRLDAADDKNRQHGVPARREEKKADPQQVRRRNLGVVPRRRAGKKDRHSKICTAQGIRDRRMRLSLQVARKFFDLQDMLGYDKASKTIEWLFTKSKKAIRELTTNHPPQANCDNACNSGDTKSESFVSECEVVSGIEESSNKETTAAIIHSSNVSSSFNNEEKNPENSGINKPNSRESREKARARARCRTWEKMMMIKSSGHWPDGDHHHHLQKLGFSNTGGFETPDQDPSFARVSPYGIEFNSLDQQQQQQDSGTIEKLLGIPTSSAACFTSSSYIDPNNGFMGFLQTWDL